MIFEYLEKLRHQSSAARQRAALIGAILGTLIIVLLWAGHFWLVDWTEETIAAGERRSVIGTEWERVKLGARFLASEIRSVIGR